MSRSRRRNSLLSRLSSLKSRSKRKRRESKGPLPRIMIESMKATGTETREGTQEKSVQGVGLRIETERATPSAPDTTAVIRGEGMMIGQDAKERGRKEKRMQNQINRLLLMAIGTDLKSEGQRREKLIMHKIN